MEVARLPHFLNTSRGCMKTYNDGHLHEPESELDELSFVTPAKESPSGPCENIDDVFGSHYQDARQYLG